MKIFDDVSIDDNMGKEEGGLTPSRSREEEKNDKLLRASTSTPKPRRLPGDDEDDDADATTRLRDKPLETPGDSTGRAAATIDAARGLRQVQVVAMVS